MPHIICAIFDFLNVCGKTPRSIVLEMVARDIASPQEEIAKVLASLVQDGTVSELIENNITFVESKFKLEIAMH